MSKKILLTLLFVFATIISNADNFIKREVRSVWLTTVWALDWPSEQGTSATVRASQQAEMIKYLDQLQADNFNAVYFQVRSMCDAFYKSSYEPWSSYLTGSRGANPGWDPLTFVVEECHKRGMECHAWVNPYRFSTGANWTTGQDNELKKSGWLLTHESTTILNPGIPEAKERIVNVCREIISNYDVDGIIFDDYFYPNGIPSNKNAGDYNLWKNSGSSLSIGDWRRANVNQMVADVYNMIQYVKPWAKFGISPAGVACTDSNVAAGHGVTPCPAPAGDWQYNGIFSDPVAWLKAGTIDYISPQLYWTTYHSTAPFGPLTKWWSEVANQFGRHHYASHSISFLAENNTETNWKEVAKQVQLSRDYTKNAAPGCVFYSQKYISGRSVKGLGEYLLANKFQTKCLTPAIDWKPAAEHGKIQNYAKSGTKMTWDAINNVRYSVYAIPTSVSKANAQSNSSSGIKSDYLLGVTYTNSYTLPSNKATGYYYAICVLDRYGNEYAPRYSDENSKPSEKVSLISPVGGSVVKSPATFKWSSASGATYTLQISKRSDMSTVNIELENLTTNSKSVDLSQFGESATIYWRIICTQTGKEPTPSDIATIKTAEYEPISGLTLTAPANGNMVSDIATITFKWTAISGASYKVEFATNNTFRQPVLSKTTTRNSIVVNMSEFDYNETYYWRVTATKSGYKETTTSTWSFQTPKRTPAPKTSLISPKNGATLAGAFEFVFKDVAADNYTLEVANSKTFDSIILTQSTGWKKENGLIKFSMTESDLARGSYYWRIVTSKKSCIDTESDSWQFNMDVAGGEDGYTIQKDMAEYPSYDKFELKNLWFRSVNTGFNNLPANTDWNFNRSFCVIDNIIYISGRIANETETECYISRYNAKTGEFISNLTLPSNVQVKYLPCNDVMKDNAGNLLVSNISLNIASNPLIIHKIDKSTGEAVQVASCSDNAGGRVDHCAVYGDVNSGNFYVFAGLSKSRYVIRWTFENGTCTNVASSYLAKLQPSGSDLGISVRVFPKNKDLIYVNSSLRNPTLYSFSTGEVVGSFENNSVLAPSAEYANGCSFFNFEGKEFFVYPNNPIWMNESDGKYYGGPYDFSITEIGAKQDFSTLERLWIIPNGGLGNVYSFYGDVLADYETQTGITGKAEGVNIYFYIPSNGLAAYNLRTTVQSGLADSLTYNFDAKYANGNVCMNMVGDIVVYNVSGICVKYAKNTEKTSLTDLEKGVYFIQCTAGKNNKTIKIIK